MIGMFCLHVCVCASQVCPLPSSQKRALGPWKLALQMVENVRMGARNQTWNLLKSNKHSELLSSPWTHFFSPTDTKQCFMMSWCSFRDKWQALNFPSISNLLCLFWCRVCFLMGVFECMRPCAWECGGYRLTLDVTSQAPSTVTFETGSLIGTEFID